MNMKSKSARKSKKRASEEALLSTDANSFSKSMKTSGEKKHWNMWRLVQQLATRESTMEFCKEQGLIASTPKCKWCCRLLSWSTAACREDGFIWRCGNRQCRKRSRSCSVRHGTWFAHSKLSLEKILVLTYCWARGMTNKMANWESSIGGGTSSQTVVDWFNNCRWVCLHAIKQCTSKTIGGPKLVVEIGESKFSLKKCDKDRDRQGKWVLGGICRQTRDVFLAEVESQEPAALISLIKEYVAPGSEVIVTDCWKSYECFNEQSMKHFLVYHSVKFIDPPTDTLTGNFEGPKTEIKQRLLSSLASSFDGRGLYLAEYIWRCRHEDKDLFQQILCDILQLYKPPQSF